VPRPCSGKVSGKGNLVVKNKENCNIAERDLYRVAQGGRDLSSYSNRELKSSTMMKNLPRRKQRRTEMRIYQEIILSGGRGYKAI